MQIVLFRADRQDAVDVGCDKLDAKASTLIGVNNFPYVEYVFHYFLFDVGADAVLFKLADTVRHVIFVADIYQQLFGSHPVPIAL